MFSTLSTNNVSLRKSKALLENKYIQIHPTKFDKLITSLRSAWAKDGVLDKQVTSYDDILDAFRLCLRPYREKSEPDINHDVTSSKNTGVGGNIL
jgi:hypothetical protein